MKSRIRLRLKLVLLTFAAVGTATAQQSLQLLSQAVPNQAVEFNVFLPLQNSDKLDQLLAAQQTPGSPSYRQWLTGAEFQAQFGSDPAQMEKVEAELRSLGLTVSGTTAHSLHVQGNVSAVKSAFGVNLWNASAPPGAQRIVSTAALNLPAALSQAGAYVTGFSAMRPARVHSNVLGPAPQNRYSKVGPYWFDDIKQAYDFPSYQALTGKGRTVAIVISSDILDSDLALYFGHEKLAVPIIARHAIDGGSGPFDPTSGAAAEASLDVQQSGGMAPGATIAIYEIPDLSQDSLVAGYDAIVDANSADVVSSSFGLPEVYYTAAYNTGVDYTSYMRAFHDIFRQGNAQGITFVASSGDSGALAAFDPTGLFLVPSIENPASDPNVTAVGGTNLVTTYKSGSLESKYVKENADYDLFDPALTGLPNEVWASGGGKSIYFSKPLYQDLLNTGSNTRSTPDISLQMGGCPVGTLTPCAADRSAVVTAIGGALYLLVGTSVSAPEFAGLLALEEQHLQTRLGNVNYQIYAESALQQIGFGNAFHKNIPGNNGLYTSPTSSGYNMVVGNGTPIGINFILAPFTPLAGTPQTPSNP